MLELLITCSLQTLWYRVGYDLRSYIALYPALFFPLLALKPSRRLAVTQHTDLVIEGFPRSANSYSVGAFLSLQPQPYTIAHHLHAPAQIIRAVQHNIPTLLLIRAPEDAVLSFKALDLEVSAHSVAPAKNLSLAQLLKRYIAFYQRVLPFYPHYVIGLFDDVIQDFGGVIERINEQYGTAFAAVNPSVDQVKCVMIQQGIHAGPSHLRQQIKHQLRAELDQEPCRSLLTDAEHLYAKFQHLSVSQRSCRH